MSDSDFENFDFPKDQEKINSSNFYGVYLMISENPNEKSKSYIGFTNDPENRLKRHNNKGGAKVTQGKGPWKMILVVHGFPNEQYALKFEWAWQSPEKSRRLKHLALKSKGLKKLEFRMTVLAHCLRTGPWCRLGLVIRWLCPQHALPFPANLNPPNHMSIIYGSIDFKKSKSKTIKSQLSPTKYDTHSCGICQIQIVEDLVSCLNETCNAKWHLVCIAERFLDQSLPSTYLLPIEGHCPSCDATLVWTRLVENITFQSARIRNKLIS